MYCHGENGDSDSDPNGEVDDNNKNYENIQQNEMYNLIQKGFSQDPNEEAQKFFNLVKVVEESLYLNCEKYFNLSFVVKLMHIKYING